MAATEIAGERRAGGKVRGPVDPTCSRVKPLRVCDIKAPELEEHAISDTGLETGTVCRAQTGRESDSRGALLDVLPCECHQFASQQISESSRRAREELHGFGVQGQVRSRQIEPGRLQLGVLLESMQRLVAP